MYKSTQIILFIVIALYGAYAVAGDREIAHRLMMKQAQEIGYLYHFLNHCNVSQQANELERASDRLSMNVQRYFGSEEDDPTLSDEYQAHAIIGIKRASKYINSRSYYCSDTAISKLKIQQKHVLRQINHHLARFNLE